MSRRGEVAALIKSAVGEAERLVERLGSANDVNDSIDLIGYEVDAHGVAVLRLCRPRARNAINTEMLVAMLAHLSGCQNRSGRASLALHLLRPHGLLGRCRHQEELDQEGKVARMQHFADLYDAIVGFPKPTIAAAMAMSSAGAQRLPSPATCGSGGSNLRMRFPGAALGVPVGPARLVTLCGLAAAKYLLLSSHTVGAEEALRLGLVNRVAPAARTETPRSNSPLGVAAHPPEAVARLKRMLHQWDAVEAR